MSKHIVFLIHGIGRHSPDWAKETGGPIEVLTEASKRYAYFQSRSLDEFVDFVPLYYDNIMSEAVSKWKSDGNTLLSAGAGVVPGVQNIGSWLGSVPEQSKDLFWDYAADIGIYRLLSAYRQRIRTELINSMAQKIESAFSANGGSPRCTVIAHSLGTTVAHDVIHALGATRWGGEDNPYGPKQWRFNTLFMLANTSRFLASEDDPYQSIVRPGANGSTNSFCSRYYNVRHKFDPVPIPKLFSPLDWGGDLRTIELDHFREINVHGFGHYLINPAVHIPLLRTIVNPGAVTSGEATQAVSPNNFPQWKMPSLEAEIQQRLSRELSSLIDKIKAKTQIDDVLQEITGYYLLIRKINDAISPQV